MSARQRVPLPLRPRFLLPGVVALIATVVICWRYPGGFFYVGEHNPSPRSVSPFEYGPTLTAVALCVGLAPRFDDWERYGAPRIRVLALLNQAATVLIPVALCLAALAVLYPKDGEPPAPVLFPLASNVAVSALLACIAIGLLGPLIGTLTWAAIAYLLMIWQSQAPTYLGLLPYTMSHAWDGHLDASPRWTWIVGLTLILLALIWTRRAVPIRIAIRPAEE